MPQRLLRGTHPPKPGSAHALLDRQFTAAVKRGVKQEPVRAGDLRKGYRRVGGLTTRGG
jgi:hypothetical protein